MPFRQTIDVSLPPLMISGGVTSKDNFAEHLPRPRLPSTYPAREKRESQHERRAVWLQARASAIGHQSRWLPPGKHPESRRSSIDLHAVRDELHLALECHASLLNPATGADLAYEVSKTLPRNSPRFQKIFRQLGNSKIRVAILALVTSLYAFGVMAQTSPDGSSITAPGTAYLTAQGSTWAFGNPDSYYSAQYDVVKQGVDIGWSGDSMWVLNGGNLYMVDSYNDVFQWQSTTFVQVSALPPAPTAPSPPAPTSPDGSSITAPGAAYLTAQGSTWAFGAPNSYYSAQYDVVRQGIDIGWSGNAMWVLNGGNLYMIDSYNDVFQWQSTTFVKVSALPPAPTPPSLPMTPAPPPTPGPQSISIFGDAVPNNPVEADYSAITLGVKFWSSQPGVISAVRFYRGAVSPQGYVARLYAANGTLLGSVNMAQESGPVPGWQEADFATPISISANQTYIAAYYAPSGQYADVFFGLTQGVTNGPLNVPGSAAVGGNGVYNYGNSFPSSTWNDSNYFVDVLFMPTTPAPYLVLNFNPGNPSITNTALLGSVVATIIPSWSDGSPFTGTLSFGPPYSNDHGTFAISGNTLIVNPSGPGVSSDANTTQQVTIVATQ